MVGIPTEVDVERLGLAMRMVAQPDATKRAARM
jgi:hypothetical protein